ncbi:MAG: hypothetical protein IKY98_02880 [Alphaproteobacteria bacterium]|nr:hypothetical protein [Alphaproteobacteria bacterium]
MKKLFMILMVLFLILLATAVGFKMVLMTTLTGTLNTFVRKIDTPFLTVRFDKAEDTCLLRPCVRFDNVYVRLMDKEFNGGTVTVEIPYSWPPRVDIQSKPDDNKADMTINATLNNSLLNIHEFNVSSGDFKADLNGQIDTQTGKFTADMDTQNLSSFLMPYIPQDFQHVTNLFLSDARQNLKLSEKNGWLTVGNFPVFPLNMATLSGFLNLNTTNHPILSDTLGGFNTFDKGDSSSGQGLNLKDLGTLLGNVLKQ